MSELCVAFGPVFLVFVQDSVLMGGVCVENLYEWYSGDTICEKLCAFMCIMRC